MLLWLLSLSVLQQTAAKTSKEITTLFYFEYPVVLHKLHVSYQFPSTKLLLLYYTDMARSMFRPPIWLSLDLN